MSCQAIPESLKTASTTSPELAMLRSCQAVGRSRAEGRFAADEGGEGQRRDTEHPRPVPIAHQGGEGQEPTEGHRLDLPSRSPPADGRRGGQKPPEDGTKCQGEPGRNQDEDHPRHQDAEEEPSEPGTFPSLEGQEGDHERVEADPRPQRRREVHGGEVQRREDQRHQSQEGQRIIPALR